MENISELKKRVYESNMELVRKGLVLYTFGNASGIDRARGLIVIKPSGVAYEDLSPAMMSVVDLNGNLVEGNMQPSSDTRTHARLYRAFLEIGGIVHTHSTYATAWAQANMPIPCLGTTHADHLPLEVPCTEVMSDEQIRGDYEEETGAQITGRFKDISPNDVQMVLVAGHGPFTWGGAPEKAVYNSVILEELARMAFVSISLNPGLGPLKKTLVDKHYERKHGKNAYYGQK